MIKERVLLVVLLFLIAASVVPAIPVDAAHENDMSNIEAATTPMRTLHVPLTADGTVVNGSYANTNFDTYDDLFLGVGYDSEWLMARSLFKFDLAHLSDEIKIQSAALMVQVDDEHSGIDFPVATHYSDDDSWEPSLITWNNQPSFEAQASSVIDSPDSPHMFEPGTWYAWDVTSDVRLTLAGDKVLTEVLKQVQEMYTPSTFKYLTKQSKSPFNASYILIEYTAPSVSDLTVNGHSTSPSIDYIRDANPDLGWQFSDADQGDFQRDYDVEVWDSQYYNGTRLWKNSHESIVTVHNSFGANPLGNVHPFGTQEEFRMQMKYSDSQIPRSGVVDKLYFTSSRDEGVMQIENLEISMLQVTGTSYLTSNFSSNYDGRTPTVVLSADLFETSVRNGVIEIDIENTFFVSAYLDLIIEIRLTNNVGDLFFLNRTFSGGPGSVACAHGVGASVRMLADYATTRTYDLKLGFLTGRVAESMSSSYNGYPFSVDPTTSGRFQIKWNQSFINRAATIDKAYFLAMEMDDTPIFRNLTVRMVETPVLGNLDHINWESNYGGVTPTVVLDKALYEVRNLGGVLVIDFMNDFQYTNTHDLLIDFQWDSREGDGAYVSYALGDSSSYRAWNVSWGHTRYNDHGLAGYDLFLDFIHGEDTVPLEGCITLANATRYYWRARACDCLGVWSEWTTGNFKYEVVTSVPTYTTPVYTPIPALVGYDVTVSLNATHATGIQAVYIEFSGTNHSMTGVGDTYSYTWAPTAAGDIEYTIYIQSEADTWSSVAGIMQVQTLPGSGADMTMFLIIGGLAVVVVVIVVMMKRKSGK